jgi:endonuclease/exonuclease/phosphatase family metal-dependent hydrolase
MWDFLYGLFCKLTSLIIRSFTPIHNRSNTVLRIMSYNIQALFPFYNTTRIDNVIRFIETMFAQNRVDIVCLQEAFELDVYDKIYEMANANHLNVVHPPLKRRYFVGENTGLVSISRYPIRHSDHIYYDISTGLCGLANKGAHYIEFAIGDGITHIVNTHLQSDNDPIAKLQFTHLLDAITSDNAIIVGDLNMSFPVVYPRVQCANTKEIITFPEKTVQYDYCLFYNCEHTSSFCVMDDIPYSDHFPIIATISIKQ